MAVSAVPIRFSFYVTVKVRLTLKIIFEKGVIRSPGSQSRQKQFIEGALWIMPVGNILWLENASHEPGTILPSADLGPLAS